MSVCMLARYEKKSKMVSELAQETSAKGGGCLPCVHNCSENQNHTLPIEIIEQRFTVKEKDFMALQRNAYSFKSRRDQKQFT